MKTYAVTVKIVREEFRTKEIRAESEEAARAIAKEEIGELDYEWVDLTEDDGWEDPFAGVSDVNRVEIEDVKETINEEEADGRRTS